MNVLIYGGCHAEVIRRSLEKYALGEHKFQKIVNFSLIASRVSFPYDILKNIDLVVFNPIHNKGEWNTLHLEEYCFVNGVRLIKYPWLQWGGYWPHAAQRRWGDVKEWSIPLIRKESEKYESISENYCSIFNEGVISQAASGWLDKTTQFLRDAEKRGSVDISIVDWVYGRYKEKRLFQTPDHPCTELYKYVIGNIASAAGLTLDKSFFHISAELQPGVMTPILPNVASALHLNFTGGEWRHDEIWGDSELTLRDFVDSHFRKSPLLLGKAIVKTVRKDILGKRAIVPAGKKFLLEKMPNNSVRHHHLCNIRLADGGAQQSLLYKPHWAYFEPEF
ncbi:hypothetical protein COAQ111491_13770 [Comamonas aquatilis]|uniref:WcbI family polysaccharide biosynthesis putative acetyltransferase n=1 Tax=Comamonas aquatilis TaxID=1778406 RepID=UPI0039F0473A